ncbi:unnamed protein product, partial [Ectocarpus fasciculatus]
PRQHTTHTPPSLSQQAGTSYYYNTTRLPTCPRSRHLFSEKMSRTSVFAALLALTHVVTASNLRATNLGGSTPAVVQHATSAAPPTRQDASRRLHYYSDDSSSDSDNNDYSPEEMYVGCFQDDEQSPLLEFGFISGDFAIERCYKHCTDEGATFMGLKYGFQCSCGFGQEEEYTLNGAGECACGCYGDPDGNCGGQRAFDLYFLGGGDDSSTSVTPSPAASSTGFPMPTGFPILSAAPSTSFTWGPTGGPSSAPTSSPTSSTMTMTDDDGGYSMTAPPTPARSAPTPSPNMPVGPTPTTPVAPPTPMPVTLPTPMPVTLPTPMPVAPRTPAPVTEEPVAPPTAPTPPGSPTPADMTELVDLHNEARCVHDAEPLTWSSAVTSSAAEHAERLTAQCSSLFHSTQEQRYGYGENLYMCWGSDSCYSHEKAMEGLYVNGVPLDKVTEYGGHATQILWKSTEKVGCVLAGCTNGGTPYTFLVCQYDPPGNYGGQYEEQVGLPDSGNSC